MVAISETTIANMALSHIGARDTIEGLDEQTAEADECRLWYDYSRQQALEAFDWNFARHRLVLTTHSAAIPTGAADPMAGVWAFRYVYPADCIAARRIQFAAAPPADPIPFAVELSPDKKTKTILTNLENAVLVYTFDQLESNLYSPSFVYAFSLALAMNVCMPLTGNLPIKRRVEKDFFTAIEAAGANSANEEARPPPRDADWLRDREGGGLGASIGGSWQAYPRGGG